MQEVLEGRDQQNQLSAGCVVGTYADYLGKMLQASDVMCVALLMLVLGNLSYIYH